VLEALPSLSPDVQFIFANEKKEKECEVKKEESPKSKPKEQNIKSKKDDEACKIRKKES
jgi:hypothetical protein